MHRVSVIVCTKNRPDTLIRCLESVAAQTTKPHEVIVIDDGESDVLELECRLSHGVRAFRYFKKAVPGLPASRNLGIKMATGDIVAFIDDDVVLHSDYLERIIEVYETDAGFTVGGVGGLVLDDFREHLGWEFFKRLCFVGAKRTGIFTRSGYALPPRGFNSIMDVDCLSGCNMTFRKAVFSECCFDEWFTDYGHGEDIEFSYRVSRGWRLRVTPTAKLIHSHDPCSRPTLRRLGFMEIYNYGYLFRRHFSHSRRTYFYFGISVTALLLRNAIRSLAGRQGWDPLLGNMRGLRALLSQSGIRQQSVRSDEERTSRHILDPVHQKTEGAE